MDISVIAEIASLLASLSIVGVNILYAVIAPWWRSTTGLSFMAVLTSFTFLIVGQVLSNFVERQWWTYIELGVGLGILAAMTWVGEVIIRAQWSNRKPANPKHVDKTVNAERVKKWK